MTINCNLPLHKSLFAMVNKGQVHPGNRHQAHPIALVDHHLNPAARARHSLMCLLCCTPSYNLTTSRLPERASSRPQSILLMMVMVWPSPWIWIIAIFISKAVWIFSQLHILLYSILFTPLPLLAIWTIVVLKQFLNVTSDSLVFLSLFLILSPIVLLANKIKLSHIPQLHLFFQFLLLLPISFTNSSLIHIITNLLLSWRYNALLVMVNHDLMRGLIHAYCSKLLISRKLPNFFLISCSNILVFMTPSPLTKDSSLLLLLPEN